jgi:hypothetical protein
MMKTLIVLLTVITLTACAAPRSSTNSLELGMSKEQVKAVMGEPDSTAASKKYGECYNYSMWRDFWNRKPGDYSDRYKACFKGNKLISYGLVE